jgi:hypothetical protein
VVALDPRLGPTPPFAGVRIADERTLRCRYRDGTQPYLLHHYIRKPWLEPTYHGVYSRLLRRLLLAPDLTVRVPERTLPRRWRRGGGARLLRLGASVRDAARWHLGDTVVDAVPEPIKDRIDAMRHPGAEPIRR